MKILFPTAIFYPSQTGGPANSVYFLAKELVKRGVDVFVFTTTLGIDDLSKIDIDKWTKLNGINIYYSSKYWHNIISTDLLNIDIPKVDLFHFSSFFNPFNLYFLGVIKKRKIPYVLSPRGELLKAPLELKKNKKKMFLLNPLVKFLFKKAILHVTSEEEENFVKGIYKKYFNHSLKKNKTIFKLTNMMDNDLLIYNNKFVNNRKYRYLLYLGRISRKKNIELLIDIYSKLNIEDDIKLFIAGNIYEDKKYGIELKNKVKELKLSGSVIFSETSIEGEEKEELYYNAELFVLTTRSENFGMVILEALAHGIPVITTKGTPWQSLNDNKCGYWVDMNFDSIKYAIEKYFLLSDNEKIEMKERGILLAKEFSSEKLVSKYIDMYNKILA